MLLDAPKFRRAAVAARQELKWSHNDTDQVDGSPALSSSEAAHATDAGDTFFNEPLWRHPALLLDMSPVVGPLKQGGGSSDDTATAASKQPLADLLSVVSADIGNISQNPSSGAAKDEAVVNLIRDAFADTAKWEAQLGDVRSKASGSGEGGSETAVGIRSLALQLFEQLSSLTVPGQLLIFPAGSLTHTYPDPEPALILLVFTVECLEAEQPVFSVMVCSAGPLGFAHHPSEAAEPPLVKLQPCVLLPRVCAARLLDRAFCSMLVHNTVVNNCSPLPVRTLTLHCATACQVANTPTPAPQPVYRCTASLAPSFTRCSCRTSWVCPSATPSMPSATPSMLHPTRPKSSRLAGSIIRRRQARTPPFSSACAACSAA